MMSSSPAVSLICNQKIENTKGDVDVLDRDRDRDKYRDRQKDRQTERQREREREKERKIER